MQIESFCISGIKVALVTISFGFYATGITQKERKSAFMFRFSVTLPEEDVKRLDLLAERYNHKRARLAGYIILKYLKEQSGSPGTALAPLERELQMRLKLLKKDNEDDLPSPSNG